MHWLFPVREELPNECDSHGNRFMIRIRIFDSYGICKSVLDEKGWVTLPDGTTLGEALKTLGLPYLFSKVMMIRLNGEKKPLNTVLSNGDVIGYFSLISGG